MQIIVQPFLAEIDYRTLNSLGKDISRELGNIRVTVATNTAINIPKTTANTFVGMSDNIKMHNLSVS